MATLEEAVRAALDEKQVKYHNLSGGVEFVLRMEETDVRVRIHTQEELNLLAVFTLWPTVIPVHCRAEVLDVINEANEKMGLAKVVLSSDTQKIQTRVVMYAHPDSITTDDVHLFVLSAVDDMPLFYDKIMRLVYRKPN